MSVSRRNPVHTPFHPRWYRRRMPIFWWLGHRAYTRFIARELTSVFVAYAAVLLLVQVWTLGRGPAAYARFLDWLATPVVVVVHSVVLAGLLFHTVTWLNLAPSAIVLHVKGRRLSDASIAAAHYAAWILVSGFVTWLLLLR